MGDAMIKFTSDRRRGLPSQVLLFQTICGLMQFKRQPKTRCLRMSAYRDSMTTQDDIANLPWMQVQVMTMSSKTLVALLSEVGANLSSAEYLGGVM